MEARVGIGYDIHRFRRRGGVLRLGGVVVPHARGLAGHSDADVLLHAITDAVLGAAGAPDLGELFPPSDPSWRQADSRIFLKHAERLVRRAGWRIGNLDAVIVADAPTLSPHKAAIRRSIGRLLKVPPSSVSLKGKTTEGFAPGGGGIAAHAVVLLKSARGSGFRARGTRSARSPEPRTRNR